MKILIEAIPRSGSTALLKALGKIYNCTPLSEPWLRADDHETLTHDFLSFSKTNNVVIKSMASQFPSDSEWKDRLNIHTKFAKQFDAVICLGRKNKREQIESFAHAIKNNKEPHEWHGKYNYKNNLLDDEYKKYGIDYDTHMLDLKSLAENLGIEIIWYEDLFSGDKNKVNSCLKNLPKDINYESLKKYIDPLQKYRTVSNIII